MAQVAVLPSLVWAHAPVHPHVVNSGDLVEALASLPGCRPVPVGAPFQRAVLVGSIEVGVVPQADEQQLRRAWKSRQAGGPIPLLAITDVLGSECVSVLLQGDAPQRKVEAQALLQVLSRVAGLGRLAAVRELGAELAKLDQEGVPGVTLRNLLTMHTLDQRLRSDQARFEQMSSVVAAVVPDGDWQAILRSLGYDLIRRPRSGWIASYDGRPVAVVQPKADASHFAKLDDQGRPAEGVLINDCQEERVEFGLLASGGRFRLFKVDEERSGSVGRYVDLDSTVLQPDDRFLLALLSPTFLAEGEFEALQSEAQSYGSALHARVDEELRQQVLPRLATALDRWASSQGLDLSEDQVRRELERASLTLIFRILFVLYAESAHYLPVDNANYRRNSLTELIAEAAGNRTSVDARSSSLWNRFKTLIDAMRTGDTSWAMPAYNGDLFAATGFDGAGTLEEMSMGNDLFGEVLIALGRDPEQKSGVDFSSLDIGHLGHIYEKLLSLRLSVADADLSYDARNDRYVKAVEGEAPTVRSGGLLWQTHEGGRKAQGVYYTRAELVRHLVRNSVTPAFAAHCDAVRVLAETDPESAAAKLLDFAVLDPSCGSGHFLVAVVDELADMVVKFLASTPLPAVRKALDHLRAGAARDIEIDDVTLLRRLVLKRCVYGVDLSAMGVEVAKVSLWLASFVPGLSLAYLGRNVVVGNSLIGVTDPALIHASAGEQVSMLDDALEEAMTAAVLAVEAVAEGEDRTPEEFRASQAADKEARRLMANMSRLFDLWTAEAFGLKGAKEEALIQGNDVLKGGSTRLSEQAQTFAQRFAFLHWPLAFPRAFGRGRGGFDAVVGNPPWEEVKVEETSFFGMFLPGIRSSPSAVRKSAIASIKERRPDLVERLIREQVAAREQRQYLSASGDYSRMAGDPDLYKFFCERFAAVLNSTGHLGIVLPRTTFLNKGSSGFRRWLFERNKVERIDFLLNTGRWAFDSEPRYSVALVTSTAGRPASDHRIAVAGVAESLHDWRIQVSRGAVDTEVDAFGDTWIVPLTRNMKEVALLAKLRRGSAFSFGAGRWNTFPVAELHETADAHFWADVQEGVSLWKGQSFAQYQPHGNEGRFCTMNELLQAKLNKPSPGSGSKVASVFSLAQRREAVTDGLTSARIAFRLVTNRRNSRTAISALLPPGTLLANSAPYLAFLNSKGESQMACLATINSLVFDWQARRFVEANLSNFILEAMTVPELTDEDFAEVARTAARLSCVDERFEDWAKACGVGYGPLTEERQQELRVEIDARICRAWALDADDLEVMLFDFTEAAVPASYRRALRDRHQQLIAAG